MIQTRTKHILITLVIITVLAGVLYAGAVYVMAGQRAKVEGLAKEIDRALYRQENVLTLEQLVASTRDAREEIREYFITRDTTVSFIEQLERLGNRGGVELTLNSANVVEDSARERPTLEVSLTARGSWESVLALFDTIEAMPVRVVIKQLSLRSVDFAAASGETVWQGDATISLESFIDE